MITHAKEPLVLTALTVVFLALVAGFWLNLWGRVQAREPIPLVDTNFLSTATVRQSYAELIRLNADVSDFDCYVCHEKGKPPTIRFDANKTIIIPKEHSNLVMGHGSHNRNNNCFNCHDDQNLEQFQTRDGRALKLSDSTPLCGSCHGPTYRDWEGGAHGRTGGFWNKASGETTRRNCVECHNPHAPKFPGRQPAPGPHLLHPVAKSAHETH
jgi:hypothetical protein